MPTFCGNCGVATGGGKFCPKCGNPQTINAGASSPGAQLPYAPAKRKSSVLKIVLIVLALIFAVCVAGAVKGYYFLKDRVREARQEMAKVRTTPAKETQAGCDLLSKERVSGILGVAVARAQGNEAGETREYCNYFSQAVDAAPADSQVDIKDLRSLAKKLSDVASHRPLLSVQVYRGNASAALIGVKTVGRIAGNDEPSITGPWDEAYFGPMDATFAVRKGDSGFLLDLTRVTKKRDSGVEIAKAMIPALQAQ